MTFLTDKKINAELYSYLLSLSFPENGETIVKKSAIPKQETICKILGIKSKTTFRTHLNYLLETGYLIEKKEEKLYIIPRMEDVYANLPLETMQFIQDTVKEQVLKVYIYLGQRWKYKGAEYLFTQEEIAEHIGKACDNARGRECIRNILDALKKFGLINFTRQYEDNLRRYKLTFWTDTISRT